MFEYKENKNTNRKKLSISGYKYRISLWIVVTHKYVAVSSALDTPNITTSSITATNKICSRPYNLEKPSFQYRQNRYNLLLMNILCEEKFPYLELHRREFFAFEFITYSKLSTKFSLSDYVIIWKLLGKYNWFEVALILIKFCISIFFSEWCYRWAASDAH